jgi:hypothetical protein
VYFDVDWDLNYFLSQNINPMTTLTKPTVSELNKAHRVIKSKLKLDLDLTKPVSYSRYTEIVRVANDYHFNNGLCEDIVEAIDLLVVQ